ncbi:MAG: glycoside hydrolase family 16 protein [Planctomycetaceae bacterium]|nr:glycoside hydrolase family 16 protein [Planctomycetaceae bacterium]
MKNILVLVSLGLAVWFLAEIGLKDSLAADIPQTFTTNEGKTLKLVWSDEFDGVGLPNPQKWGYEYGFVRNRESQFYTREREKNVYQKNGVLTIESFKEHFEENGQTAEITSGSITTEGKAAWTYGRIEVSAKLPKGRGAWPAIWMLGTNIREIGWPKCGEIDIMEYVGFNPTQIHATVHAGDAGKHTHTSKGSFIRIPEVEDRFAVYAVEWTKDKMDFFVDDELYFTFKRGDRNIEPWPFDKPHYLILNTAIGGAWGGAKGIDEAIFPCRFEIDYVRVYQ